MDTSYAEKEERRKKRQSKQILDTLQARIKEGSATIEMMAWLLTHPMARLNHKLTGIDDAYASGLLTRGEVGAQQVEPNRSDFGLPEGPYLTPFDRLKEWGAPGGTIKTSVFAIWFLGCWAVGFLALRAAGYEPGDAAGKTWFYGFPFAIVAMIVIAFARELWNAQDPMLKAEQAYKGAMLRYEVIGEVRRLTIRAKTANAMYQATGPEFEVLVARAFRKWGYKVTECGGANDGGVDLIVTRGQEHALVQCKAHGKSIGPAVLRDLYGALGHSKANYAYLASLHGVSSNAADWVRDKPISVLTTDDLVLEAMPDRIAAKRDRATKRHAR